MVWQFIDSRLPKPLNGLTIHFVKQRNEDNDELIYRAVMAFFKDQIKYPKARRRSDWPSESHSGLYRYNAREYVVLRSQEDKALAVYRVRPSNGFLRRLFNYPPALEEEPEKAGPLYKKIV